MEQWQVDFEWLKVRHQMKELFKKDTLPDLNAILLLIGVQESGYIRATYTKEEKQDLMHVAVCQILSQDGYFEMEGLDQDGWPHYKVIKPVPVKGVEAQELFLKEKVIAYFKQQGI